MAVRFVVEARPGAARRSIQWDPWRSAWVVHVPEKPERGRANVAILACVAAWLAVDPGSLRWVRAGRGTSKIVEVDGLSDTEVQRRLRAAAAGTSRSP